jgi:glycosyltransferase involved in cell wall biosynthesis
MTELVFVTAALAAGGAERAINHVSKILEDQYSVGLICINDSSADLAEPCKDVTFLNRPYGSKLFPTLVTYIKFVKVLLKKKPKYLVLNCDLPEFFGAFAPLGPKIIFLEHAAYPWMGKEMLGRLIRRVLILRGAKCIAVSNHLKVWPQEKRPNYVISNPVIASSLNYDMKSTVTLKRLVFIGRFMNIYKNPEVVYELCKHFELKGLMIGEGSEREKIMKLAQEFSLQIDFPGQVTNPWQLIETGDLIIVPSSFEGDGLVVVEAIINGMPILLSDIPDFRRFGLPSSFYCANETEFREKIDSNRTDLRKLCAPENLMTALESERGSKQVGSAWSSVLRDLNAS